jgi:excisionase family DNA binding protein
MPAATARIRSRREDPPHELITLKEAAAYLRVTERQIYRWMAEGKIRPWRAGTRLRFDKAEIQAFLVRG